MFNLTGQVPWPPDRPGRWSDNLNPYDLGTWPLFTSAKTYDTGQTSLRCDVLRLETFVGRVKRHSRATSSRRGVPCLIANDRSIPEAAWTGGWRKEMKAKGC